MVACESLAPCCLPDFEGWVSPSGSVCLRRCKLADKEVFTVSCVGIWVSSEKEGAIIGMALKKEMGDACFKVFTSETSTFQMVTNYFFSPKKHNLIFWEW